MSYDAIIVGLGAMGSATAYQLASRGKSVLGLEQFEAAHDRGSSHGQSRMIRQAYMEGAFYIPLLKRAYELWDRLEQESNRSILTITGGLFMGTPESGVVRDTLAAAREYDLPVAVLEYPELKRRYPLFQPEKEHVGVLENVVGYLDPELAIKTYLECAARQGADLRFSEAVLRVEISDGGGVRVVTGRDSYEAAQLIITAGAWSESFLKELTVPVPLKVERLVMHWFRPAHPEWFAPDVCPIWIWEVDDGIIFYGFPLAPGADSVKVAFHTHQRTTCTADDIERTIATEEVSEMERYLTRYVSAVGNDHQRSITCMYTSTPDGHFAIGRHPSHSQVLVAAGFSGHGFKFAGVVGEILAELAIDGKTRHDISAFALDRF